MKFNLTKRYKNDIIYNIIGLVILKEITMEKIADFYKVSYEQFKADWEDSFGSRDNPYDDIKIPARATAGSAGYDFYSPLGFELKPGETIKIPTGIKARMNDGWVLMIFPRSGLGFKYRLQLNNTVGIIDSDYIGSDNEGHIFIKVTNDSNENKILSVKAGEGFAQGIFLPFGITNDDTACAKRNGGFGSTTGLSE